MLLRKKVAAIRCDGPTCACKRNASLQRNVLARLPPGGRSGTTSWSYFASNEFMNQARPFLTGPDSMKRGAQSFRKTPALFFRANEGMKSVTCSRKRSSPERAVTDTTPADALPYSAENRLLRT